MIYGLLTILGLLILIFIICKIIDKIYDYDDEDFY
jgi:hypothetical protein